MKNKNDLISQCNLLSNKTIQSVAFIIGDVTFYKYLLESINHTLLQMSTEMRKTQECFNL
jgi:ERCC4-type nuclease